MVFSFDGVKKTYQKFKSSKKISEEEKQQIRDYITRRERLNKNPNFESFTNYLRIARIYAKDIEII